MEKCFVIQFIVCKRCHESNKLFNKFLQFTVFHRMFGASDITLWHLTLKSYLFVFGIQKIIFEWKLLLNKTKVILISKLLIF